MPAPLSTALLVFGAVLTTATVVGGVAVAACGLILEAYIFVSDGTR